MHRLVKLNILSFALHATSGAIGFVLSNDANIDIPVFGNYASFNQNGQNEAAVFVKNPPVKVFSYNVFKALASMEIITAAFQIYYIIEQMYLRGDVNEWKVRPARSIEYAITATLLTITNLIATGGNDIILVVVVIGSSVGLQACGALSEYAWVPPKAERGRVDDTDNKGKVIMNVVALVQGCILLFTVVGAIAAQIGESGNVDPIWRNQVAAYSIYFSTFGINALLRAINFGRWKDFVWTETVYTVLSVCSKVSLFWMATAATRQVQEERQFAPRTAGVNWDVVRYSAMILPGTLGVAYLTTIYFRQSDPKDAFFGPRLRRLRL